MVYIRLIKLLKQNRNIISIFLSCTLSYQLSCQDLKGAFFQTKFVNGYKYSCDLYLLTDLNTASFRPYVLINWGPQIDTLKFIQSNAYSNTLVNKFNGNFTYPGPGIYKIIFNESFRISGIKNIISSQSESIQITSTLVINPFNGTNNSPLFQNYPIYFGKSTSEVFYDPMFVDLDGDSLAYSLDNCKATNYYIPVGVNLYNDGTLGFSKDSLGIYAFSYTIHEWRKVLGNYVNVGISQIDFVIDINGSIGIKENNDDYKIIVCPNPADQIIIILSENYFDSHSKIIMYNSLGEIVLTSPFSKSVDVSELPPGCYLLKIKSQSGEVYVKRFLVAR